MSKARRNTSKSRGGGGGGVHCVKPSDPPFLRALKERCGYTSGPDINTKRALQRPDPEDGDDDDRNDERPQVVVLREGDITQEEADRLFDRERDQQSGPEDKKGDDVTAKPNSKDGESSGGRMLFSSGLSKRRKDGDETGTDQTTTALAKKKMKLQEELSRKKDVKAVKDNRLLSFDQEDDGDDDAGG